MENAAVPLPRPRQRLPDAPVLVAGPRGALLLAADGELEPLSLPEAALAARARPPIVCHMPALARRLDSERFPALDLLQLWAFVPPARFCLPTPRGLALALDLPPRPGLAGEAAMLHGAMRALLGELAARDGSHRQAVAIARTMAAGGWRWGPSVLAALGATGEPGPARGPGALAVWGALGEWAEPAPAPAPGNAAARPPQAPRTLCRLP